MGKKNHRMLQCVCGRMNPVIYRKWRYCVYSCRCGIVVSAPTEQDVEAKLNSRR